MRKCLLVCMSLALTVALAAGCGGGSDDDPCEGLTLCTTAGDMQCNAAGTAIQSCGENADGCLVWNTTTTCGARQICDDTGAEPVCECEDTCATANDTQCAGNVVQTCTADADGCLAWANGTDCAAANQTCVDGECVGGTVCTDGATRCDGNVVQTCAANTWTDTTDCTTTGETCQVDGGVAQCQGGVVCTDGATRCEDNWVQTCADNAWTNTTDCDTDICVLDAGVAQCQTPIACDPACDPMACEECDLLTGNCVSTCTGDQTCDGAGNCVSGGCTEIVYAGNLVDLGSDGTFGGYYADLDTALGDAGIYDYSQFEFYDGTTGTIDLGDATNGNYISCMQCVRVFEDVDENTGAVRQYFQQSGTMVIDAAINPLSGTAAFDLADVTLVEVTIAADYTSTPVEGGECIHITAVSLDTSINGCPTEGATQCAGDVVQTCTDGAWVDGTDCAGTSQLCDVVDGTATCVDSPCTDDPCATVSNSTGVCTVIDASTYSCGCDSGYSWHGDSLTCEVQTCTEIVFAGNLVDLGSDGTFGGYYADLDTALGDAGLLDYSQFEFYDGTTGTVDLGSVGVNDNYATCMQCVRFFEDYDENAGSIARQYFQESGTIVIDGGRNLLGGDAAFALADVTLVEVTIASDGSYTSTPVVGGECLHITAVSLDTSIDGCNTEGASRCTGTLIQTCTGGVWVDGTDCDGTSQLCDVVDGTATCVDSPCTSDPCASVANSDGVCTIIDASTYECGCDMGHLWNDTSLTCDALTCNATVLTTAGVTAQDSCSGTTLYNAAGAGDSCTGYNSNGSELVYSLEVPDGNLVSISMDADFDASLWVTTDCLDLNGELCVAGSDGGNPESVMFSNNTGAAMTYYIIADGYSSCGIFDLTVDMGVDPCANNPCAGDTNSDGVCTTIDPSTYECGCNDGYLWDDVNLVCEAFACPATAITAGTISDDNCNGTSMYSAGEFGASCTGYSSNGSELLYALDVAAGASYTIVMTASHDASLWVTTSCFDFTGASCVVGGDDPEEVTFTNDTGADATYYIIADSFSNCGPFDLTVTQN